MQRRSTLRLYAKKRHHSNAEHWNEQMGTNMPTTHLVYGFYPLQAVLTESPARILQLYILDGRKDDRVQKISTLAEQLGIKIQIKSRQQLDKLADGAQHQGMLAECKAANRYSENDLFSLLDKLKKPPFLLILDNIQDPHNLGACLRSANAAGVDAVIAPKDKSVGLTPAVYRVSCGAAEITPFIAVTNLARTMEQLKKRDIWLYGAAAGAKKSLYQMDLSGAIGLVLGSEGKGMRQLTEKQCDELMTIPMKGEVDSLNVSVATGVCLFEALRQRS